ncbi:MAG: DUF1232 domain-containing protein [Candidatus Sumerlaeia bacterium]|nr:DUF1232 domain-containing protein [Candidatus Sumerlaeia bacterium]
MTASSPLDSPQPSETRERSPRSLGHLAGRLVEYGRLFRQMMRDRSYRIDWVVKLQFLACGIYFISPIDLIPDFLFGIGYVDDMVVLGYAVTLLRDVLDEYRRYRIQRAGNVVDVEATPVSADKRLP